MSALKYTLRRWLSAHKYEDQPAPPDIYVDDTIGVARAKIAAYVGGGISTRDVWTWASRPCLSPSKSAVTARDVARQIMAPFHTISVNDAVSRIDMLFPDSAASTDPPREAKHLSFQSVVELVARVDRTSMVEPLGHNWVCDANDYDGQLSAKQCNPFLSDMRADPLLINQVLRAVSENAMLIERKFSGADHVVIEFVVQPDVVANYKRTHESFEKDWERGFLAAYFPESVTLASDTSGMIGDRGDIDPEFLKYDNAVRRMTSTGDLPFVANVRISYYHVKVETPGPRQRDVSLHDVFAEFETSQLVPVILFKSDAQVLHKIHRGSLNRLADEALLSKWLQRKPRQNVQYVMFYIRISNRTRDIYCNLVVYSSLRYDITVSFPRTSYMGGREDVQAAIQLAQPLVEYVRSRLVVGSVLPDIESQFLWGGSARGACTQVLAINAHVGIGEKSSNKIADSSQVRDVVSRLMKTEFVLVDNIARRRASSASEADNIVMQYRRVDNFVVLTEMQHFLIERLHLNRALQIQQLMKHFNVSATEAQQEVNAWILTRAKMKADFGNVESAFVSSVMVFPSKTRAKLRIQGATSLAMLDRIIQSQMHALKLAKSKRLQGNLQRDMHGAQKVGVAVAPERSRPTADFVQQLLLADTKEEEGESPTRDQDQEETREQQELAAIMAQSAEDEGYDDEEGNASPERDQRVQLEMLSRHDPVLFASAKRGYRSYATCCGKVDERQPVVIDKQRQDAEYPDGYGEAVLYGSDPSNMLYYACPDVWCPKSKIAMTYEQYEKRGRKCPASEIAMTFENRYWNGRKKRRHIGFLDPSKHPRGLCMPCCFKKKQKNFTKCGVGSDDAEGNSDALRYVKNDQMHILEPGRLSLLPPALLNILPDNVCGSRRDGSGPLTDASNCVARTGMPRSDSPFLSIVSKFAASLDKDVSAQIASNIDVKTFVTLQAGAVYRYFCRDFVSARYAASRSDYRQFVKFVSANPDQFDRATADGCRKYPREFSWTKMADFAPAVFRSLCLYKGLLAFREAVLQGKLGHDFLTDAAHAAMGIKVVTFEMVNEDVYAFIPGAGVAHDEDFFATFCIDSHYEPVAIVTTERRSGLVNMQFTLNALKDGRFARLVDTFAGRSDPVETLVAGLREALRGINLEPTDLLICCRDGPLDLAACGLRVRRVDDVKKAPLLLPFPKPLPLSQSGGIGWIHLDEAIFQLSGRGWTPAEVKAILDHLRIVTGDDGFAPVQRLASSDRVVGIAISSASASFAVPCGDSDGATQVAIMNRDAFAQPPPKDQTILETITKIELDSMFDTYALAVFKILETDDDDLQQELRFLRSDFNPFPKEVKQARARKLMRHALQSNPSLREVVQFSPDMVKPFVERLTIALIDGVAQHSGTAEMDMLASPNEILLSETDVDKLFRAGVLTRAGLTSFVDSLA